MVIASVMRRAFGRRIEADQQRIGTRAMPGRARRTKSGTPSAAESSARAEAVRSPWTELKDQSRARPKVDPRRDPQLSASDRRLRPTVQPPARAKRPDRRRTAPLGLPSSLPFDQRERSQGAHRFHQRVRLHRSRPESALGAAVEPTARRADVAAARAGLAPRR
jgi:hypothetical protein